MPTSADRGSVTWSARRIPMAVNLGFLDRSPNVNWSNLHLRALSETGRPSYSLINILQALHSFFSDPCRTRRKWQTDRYEPTGVPSLDLTLTGLRTVGIRCLSFLMAVPFLLWLLRQMAHSFSFLLNRSERRECEVMACSERRDRSLRVGWQSAKPQYWDCGPFKGKGCAAIV